MAFFTRRRSDGRPRRGFTIIELLTVITIITLLIGLILPSIAAVRRKARKTNESNNVRQVGAAWQNYASSSNDACLPGYLNGATQDAWGVQYSFVDETVVPAEIAAPYTWRLLPYFGHKIETLTAYWDNDYTDLEDPAVVEQIALQPAFGYNAYYLGGWFQMQLGDLIGPRFQLENVVARSISQIQKSSDMVVFCSSSVMQSGNYHSYNDQIPGAHYVVPPFLGQVEQWNLGFGGGGGGGGQSTTVDKDISILEVMVETGVPIGRYTDRAAICFADWHVEDLYSGELVDPRKWIYIAPDPDDSNFAHTPLPW